MGVFTGGTISSSRIYISAFSTADQLLVFQGTYANPSFIYAFSKRGPYWTPHDWSSHSANSSCSDLPPGLTDGVNAIVVYPLVNSTTTYYYNAWYAGPMTAADPNTWRARVADLNNWTGSENSSEPYTIHKDAVMSVNSGASVSITSSTNVSCNGGTDGVITATVTGGAPNYNYSWSNGASTTNTSSTTNTISSLSAGTYTVTVTDNEGTTDNTSITITEPTALIASAVADSMVSCNGWYDGGATASATGGETPYSYSWSNGATTASITGVSAGTYTITITDANGCSDDAQITITEPTALIASAVADSMVSCNGWYDGGATASATGGETPYSYSWSNGATTASITGVGAGTYTITITDANGCSDDAQITITEPTSLNASAVADSMVSCNGWYDGGATASATGGETPYSYSWSNGATTASIAGVGAGTYTITITDANGCSDDAQIIITEPTALIASAVADSMVSCNGWYDGGATASATGGESPYSYSWSNGATTASIAGVGAGTYTITITDANGCSDDAQITITEPTSLIASAVADSMVSCNGWYDGGATASATGGETPYSYSWSNGATTASITGVGAGTYTITITDANGCSDDAQITITEPTSLNASAVADSMVSCNGWYDGGATASATGGTTPYRYSWSNGATTASITGVGPGTYTITITDANGCSDDAQITITEPSALEATAVVDSMVSRYSYSDGGATASALGGTTPYSYLWSNSATTASIAGVSAGIYTVTVKDANGCSSGANVTITEPAVIQLAVSDPVLISEKVFDGQVIAAVSAGVLTNVESGDEVSVMATAKYDTKDIGAGKTITVMYTISGRDASDYAAPEAKIVTTGRITQKTITVTADASQTKVYGDSDPTLTYTVSPALITGDSFTGALSRAEGEAVNTYAIAAGTLSAGGNYDMSFVGDDFSITQKPITVTADASQTKVYGDSDPTLTYTVSPALITGDSFTGALTRAEGEAVNTYAIAAGTLSAGGNYDMSFVGDDFTINKKTITVTADASQTKVYGDSDPAFTYSVSPALIARDVFTGALTRVEGEAVNTYAIATGTLSAGGNYDMSFVSDDFTINKKTITVTADAAQTKVYGDSDPTLTYTVSPALITGDSFTGALTRAEGEAVNTYAIAAGTLSAGGNYDMSFVSDDFTINKKTITVTADASQTKVYGDSDPAFTYSVSPALIARDVFTGALTRVEGEAVNTYAIAAGTLSAGGNYDMSYVGDDFTITQKPITVTADASQNKSLWR